MRFKDRYCDESYIVSDDERPIVSVKDSGSPRQWIGLNQNKKNVVKYRVDGGIVTSKEESKCDYAVCVDNITSDTIYLIELKGCDYKHALDQISSTLDKLIISPGIADCSVNGRVVLSRGRNPKIRCSTEPPLIKKLMLLKGNLASKTNKLQENI